MTNTGYTQGNIEIHSLILIHIEVINFSVL
jgi:hypothetical protein